MEDVCKDCGHRWHGLVCGHVQAEIGEHGISSTRCSCPSQFVDNWSLTTTPDL